jgi:hypothetical protein
MQKKPTTLLQHGTALSLNRRYDTGEKIYTDIKRRKFNPKVVLLTQGREFECCR